MPTAITEASIVTPNTTIARGTILIADDGRITDVGDSISPPADAIITAAPGLTIVPGFIDLHVHGGGGFSLATTDPTEIEAYARWVVAHGVTSFLATICAGDLEEALSFLRTAAQVVDQTRGGANLLGLNLEGPFVNPDRRGALLESWNMAADPLSFDGLVQAAGNHLRIMTLAPELPNALKVLRIAVAKGIVVAVGHTDASYDCALNAFQAGASHVTHAFNAMHPFHHRDPGPIGAALKTDDVTVEAIADGVHLHPSTVGLLVHAFGPARIALVTDGVTPAGLDAGAFSLGEHEARLIEGRMLLPDGTIAGSATTIEQLVRNVVDWGFADLAGAASMASTVPARILGQSATKGAIIAGYDADLVALDRKFLVTKTWVGGKLLHSRA